MGQIDKLMIANSKDELKHRLKLAMAKMNMRPVELVEKTKIPKSSISQYMSGYSKPNSERVYLISKALDVSEAWLMGFDVPMERVAEEFADEGHTLYDKLDTEDKAEIRGEMKHMLKADKYSAEPETKR